MEASQRIMKDFGDFLSPKIIRTISFPTNITESQRISKNVSTAV